MVSSTGGGEEDEVEEVAADEIVETEFEGKSKKIRFLNPELGLIKTDAAMPLHVFWWTAKLLPPSKRNGSHA